MAHQPERGIYPLFFPLPSSFPDARLDGKSLSPLTCWPWLPPALVSKEPPIYIYPTFPGYPLLPVSYLFTYGAQPSAQCPYLFMLPPEPTYPTVAGPSLLRTANGPGPRVPQEKTLVLYSGACQGAGHTLHSQAGSRSSGAAWTPGVAARARRSVPGSRAGVIALPYPLKKENGKILYECNVCGKNFGQLSNLKVSASRGLLPPSVLQIELSPAWAWRGTLLVLAFRRPRQERISANPRTVWAI